MNWKYAVSALLLIYSMNASGQSHSLLIGGGVTIEALRDEGYSPLRYSGTGLTGLIGFQISSAKRETIWLFSYGDIRTTSRFGRELTTTSMGLLNLNFYKRENAHFIWGWANNNGFHQRFIDGFSNFNGRTEFFSTLGPAVKYERDMAIKSQRFTVRAMSQLQLIGFYLPSGYVASLPGGFGYEPSSGLKSFWESVYLFYPGNSWNASFWPRVDWHLSSGNSISLNYLYEYARFRGAQMHERSSGIWFLTLNMLLR